MINKTHEQICDLKFKLENSFLKEWSSHYGIIDCMTKIVSCLACGFGYMGAQRIDYKFLASLSHNDICIYNEVIAWFYKK